MKEISIVIIDADERTSLQHRTYLQQSSTFYFDVKMAKSIQENLAICDKQQVDCILLEHPLPGINSIELMRDIRYGPNHFTPIIILSQIEDPEVAVKAMKEGAADFIIKKNADANKLIKAISDALLISRFKKKAKKQTKLLEHFAYYDYLTHVFNRGAFEDIARRCINYVCHHGQMLAVFYIDVDDFKQVNDVLGHNMGDRALCEFAASLRHCLRKTDIIGRVGGDEFVALLRGFDSTEDLVQVVKKIFKSSYKAYGEGMEQIYLTACIGVAICPQDGTDLQTLTECADIALYQAKDQGKSQYAFYRQQ